ncbi:MAG: hypothetical protein CL917_03010 [Deltaproteobacteria bacterium]|nr:hypothetical protein [Deltaproteobacteria bacterium]
MSRGFMDRYMQRNWALGVVFILSLSGLLLLWTPPAGAASKSKSIKTEAFFVSLDTEKNLLEVRVKKTGKRPKNKKLKLKTGKSATFKVKPEGSVLKRTTVALDGQRVDINEIEKNQFLFIYWVPDEMDPDVRFARKIDLVLTDEQMDARNEARMEAARAAGQLQSDDD